VILTFTFQLIGHFEHFFLVVGGRCNELSVDIKTIDFSSPVNVALTSLLLYRKFKREWEVSMKNRKFRPKKKKKKTAPTS